MGYKKGEGGRPKGVKNSRNRDLDALIDASPLGPAEAYLAVLNNDWGKLGYDSGERVYWLQSGIEVAEPLITLDHKLSAAKELMKYRYAQKKAMELSTGDTGIKIVIEDYTKK